MRARLESYEPGFESVAFPSDVPGYRMRAWMPFDDARSHRIQAAADFFVMPSRVPRGRPGRQRAQLRPGEASHRLERRPAPFDADGVTIATCPADVVLG
jgi:hypothetical protein